ncbi:antirestriction protein ArdA [Gordonia sp. NPDC127522]|uniref:antirestriction protein ArdA n=1 Tax=Gordonia sp. NPDC127522 TaxID=3345390 RepID=UPI00363D2733
MLRPRVHPVDGEFNPMEATRGGEAYDELDDADLWPAVCARVRSGSSVAEGNSDTPALGDFQDRYCGSWGSFVDYVHDLAEDTGTFRNVPEELRQYIDTAAWARDIEADYTTGKSPEGGYFVFRSY